MKKDRINILIGSDINYAPYYGVMLTSLFMNNTESLFDVYLLTDNSWTTEETRKFEKMCEDYNSRFFVYVVNVDLVKDFPKILHIALPTYYRLQACNILPSYIHKILYLDGDMIVTGDIRPLWEIDLEGYALAATDDTESIYDENYTRLGFDKKYGYFNAGVSLYNFDFWRKNNISEKMLQRISEEPEKFKWMDQDAANMFLHDKRYNLSLRYNFQVKFLNNSYWDLYTKEYQKIIETECENAVVVHFCSPIKPWTFRYLGYPFFKTWMFYNRNSFWKINIKVPYAKYLKQCIKRIIMPARVYANRNMQVIQKYWNYK